MNVIEEAIRISKEREDFCSSINEMVEMVKSEEIAEELKEIEKLYQEIEKNKKFDLEKFKTEFREPRIKKSKLKKVLQRFIKKRSEKNFFVVMIGITVLLI